MTDRFDLLQVDYRGGWRGRITHMVSLARLLSAGYFPREIPPAFDTSTFASALSNASGLPSELTAAAGARAAAHRMGTHNLARVGQLRRSLGLPGPIYFYRLAKELADNWAAVEPCFQTELSATTPLAAKTGRAVRPRVGHRDRTQLRVKARSGNSYIVFADIARCYGSIYTHSIPWAVHGKAQAKQNKTNYSLLGNRLDYWARQAQDSQTLGVPIGPDTSGVLAEIVLSAIDRDFVSTLGPIRGHRMIDDYEFCFDSLGQAEEALARFQESLGKFELQLNESKTRIERLPMPLDPAWVSELRKFSIRKGKTSQVTDLLAYFSIAFQRARENPTDSVLAYTIQRLSSLTIRQEVWPVYQDLLFQCASSEPGTLKFVLRELDRYAAIPYGLKRDELAEIIGTIVRRHSRLGHGSEVAWSIWTAIKLKLELQSDLVPELSRLTDPFVPLLALDAADKGLFGDDEIDKTAWAASLDDAELNGPNWLLAYEATVRNWLPPPSGRDILASSEAFKFFRDSGVRFYRDASVGADDEERGTPLVISAARSIA